jgi:hypothetical protein
MSKHFLSSELGLKIASLHPLGVIQSDISSMDKLTSCELNRLITQETRREGDASDMGHLLPLIFKSFDPTNLPATDTLKDSTNKPLYDTTTKQWSLALPKKGEAIEKTFPFFLNNLTKALLRSFPSSGSFPPLWYGSSSTVPVESEHVQRKPDVCLSEHTELRWNTILVVAELTTTSYTPSIPAGKTLDTKAWLVFREQPWRRFILSLSFSNNYRELRVHVHDHSGGIVTPEINIHENPDAFKYIMACIVFGQRDCIGFDLTITINPKMTSLLSGAFWARNVKGLPKRSNQAARLKSRRPYSLDAQTELTQSHALDTTQTIFHSLPDQLPSPAEFADEPRTDSSPLVDPPDLKNTKDDDVIGKITVNENVYELLKVIFCNQGLVGRGTVCYLARRDGEEFIIKDHWVKGDKTIVLNEVEMLKTLKDIPGVPQYIEHCLVEVEPGKVDDTQMYRQKIYSSTQGVYRTHVRLVLKPRARPLHEFRTRKELVKALRDIVLSEFVVLV